MGVGVVLALWPGWSLGEWGAGEVGGWVGVGARAGRARTLDCSRTNFCNSAAVEAAVVVAVATGMATGMATEKAAAAWRLGAAAAAR